MTVSFLGNSANRKVPIFRSLRYKPYASICAVMASVISLAAYSVNVWNPHDREDEYLSDFDGEGGDVLDFLGTVLGGIKAKTLDQVELQQAFSIPRLDKRNRTLSGIIETGRYGHESDLINVKTSKVVYQRKKTDAEMLPFYFYFEIPEGVEEGILILQRTSAFGIRKILAWVLKVAFEKQYPEYKLKIAPVVAESEVKKFIKGKIQKIHLIKKTIPADIADSYDKGHHEVHGTVELVIRASKRSTLPMNTWLSGIFQNRRPGGVFAVDEEDFAYDNVRAEVKIGHATRTVDAARPERIRSYFDVTDKVQIGPKGHPLYNSIQEQADKLAEELRALLYGAA